MASDTITVPRELFERLIEHAIDLQAAWYWKRRETRMGYADVMGRLDADVDLAVAIRDRTDLPSGD